MCQFKKSTIKELNVLGIEVFVQTLPCAFHTRHSGNVQQREI